MAEVRCATHGVFDYKTTDCPGCFADARRRYEQLVVEIEGEAAFAQRTLRLHKPEAEPAPISARALAALRDENPGIADKLLAVLEREQLDFAARQHERELVMAGFAALSVALGKTHRLGTPGSSYKGRLLGAVDVGAKRYARLKQDFLDGGETVCVPWIDAFAEYTGRDIAVQWLDMSSDKTFRVSDRDGLVSAALQTPTEHTLFDRYSNIRSADRKRDGYN